MNDYAAQRYKRVEFLTPPRQCFQPEEGERASDEWGFNCGPYALCMVLGTSPEKLRPYLGDFETKRYTNPTLMRETLKRIGVSFSWSQRNRIVGRNGAPKEAWPDFGLVRIQWGGPWTKPGVPIQARYRHTHWIVSWQNRRNQKHAIADVNATPFGGWLSLDEWSSQFVPWLLKECEPKADGTWWLTHAVTIGVENFGRWIQ